MLAALVVTMLLAPAAEDLAAGQHEMNSGNWLAATKRFNSAINSGELNEPGILLAYWNLYYAYNEMGDSNNAGESLLGFIVHADELLYRTSMITGNRAIFYTQFIVQFKLPERMEHAKNALDILWMQRVPWACRKPEYACVISNRKSINLFAERLPFCGINREITENDKLLTVKVACDESTEYYYFFLESAAGE
jgi:hypothetical protein